MFDEHIPTYRQLLDILRKKDSTQLIRNDSVAHASVLVSNIVSHAKEEILIYSSSFCKGFYLSDEIKDAFAKSREKSVPVKLIIHFSLSEDEDIVGQAEAIEAYLGDTYGKDFFKMKFLDDNASISFDGMVLNNFIVTDKKSFRYEKTEPLKEACVSSASIATHAVGSLNDPDTAGILANAFHDAFDK